jgi:hypothetical protein
MIALDFAAKRTGVAGAAALRTAAEDAHGSRRELSLSAGELAVSKTVGLRLAVLAHELRGEQASNDDAKYFHSF